MVQSEEKRKQIFDIFCESGLRAVWFKFLLQKLGEIKLKHKSKDFWIIDLVMYRDHDLCKVQTSLTFTQSEHLVKYTNGVTISNFIE